jgi:hypothetical protein
MRRALLCFLAALPLAAHVGSPDVFFEGAAGPYKLLVTIRPPEVVPGVAEIEIRSLSPELRRISVLPLRLTRDQQFAPLPDLAKPAKEDPQFYTGSLWLMATGTWQVRIDADGALGPGSVAVPVPALPQRVLGMQAILVAVLIPLAAVLALGTVGIAGAYAREGILEPGKTPDAAAVRRARRAMAIAGVIVTGAFLLGWYWWNAEDDAYRGYVFKPMRLQATVTGGNQLLLRLENPKWLNRSADDLAPDHGHLMHLYVIRVPAMDRVWHLHPERNSDGAFAQSLPSMPAGRYALFGDVVHENGLPETATATIDVPEINGSALAGDDSGGQAPPLSSASALSNVSPLSNGYRMIWDRGAAPLHARQPNVFTFRVVEANGNPATAMQLYMGMLGHAAFVRTDLGVFAHLHPSGSAPMPALALTHPEDPHAGHAMHMADGELPAQVSFPYGFPSPGAYRIFVQMKRGDTIETGVFDAAVVK